MFIRSYWRQIAAILWVALAVVVSLVVIWRLKEERLQRDIAALPPLRATAAAKPDPRLALAAALKLPDPSRREREFGALLRDWAEDDTEAALAYVRQRPRDANFSPSFLIVLDALSRKDETRALQVAGEFATTRTERAFYGVMFDRMARHNPAAAAARLAAVPEGEGRTLAVRAVAEVWTTLDPAAAFAWAEQLKGTERTTALESHLTILADTAPRQAIEHAQKALAGAALERASRARSNT
jgi:hypothetical protein